MFHPANKIVAAFRRPQGPWQKDVRTGARQAGADHRRTRGRRSEPGKEPGQIQRRHRTGAVLQQPARGGEKPRRPAPEKWTASWWPCPLRRTKVEIANYLMNGAAGSKTALPASCSQRTAPSASTSNPCATACSSAASACGPSPHLAGAEAVDEGRRLPAGFCRWPARSSASTPTRSSTTTCRPWTTTTCAAASRPTTPCSARRPPSSPATACSPLP